jgi:orotate phosphoribosyltransferase
MDDYKKEFIEFMVQSKVLIFGDFMTKSGRKTPYFVNTGKYQTGDQMKQLGDFYAQAIHANFDEDINVLFGPAYKGIPLVVTSSIALSERYDRNVSICFNRKETKDHGEGGNLIGKKLADGDKVIIVEDVTTAGTSIRQTVPLLNKAAFIQLKGLVVSVDRMEKGQSDRGALVELAEQYNMKTCAIVTLDEIVEHLLNRPIAGKIIIDDEMKSRIDDYREIYGSKK